MPRCLRKVSISRLASLLPGVDNHPAPVLLLQQLLLLLLLRGHLLNHLLLLLFLLELRGHLVEVDLGNDFISTLPQNTSALE